MGDQVVVPVRETCAQALGTLATYMDKESVLTAFSILLSLQQADKWEVRHGSLLGLEYLIAVRQDLVDFILPQALPSIIRAFVFFFSFSFSFSLHFHHIQAFPCSVSSFLILFLPFYFV